ncbi:MAG: hypothetical protein COB67_03355 [SAR324 cluster bacterium]|uniref:Poly(3-hydroxyalkanoate) polymerase subunit PhaE n=1 Tax=SAR324 cluster bacterium TaxID=2024889 RepID=A0A2A4T854_9DELT|nr:MAG: hypothetical protein COB67_03355 [SAR324 cluster bacterium]
MSDFVNSWVETQAQFSKQYMDLGNTFMKSMGQQKNDSSSFPDPTTWWKEWMDKQQGMMSGMGASAQSGFWKTPFTNWSGSTPFSFNGMGAGNQAFTSVFSSWLESLKTWTPQSEFSDFQGMFKKQQELFQQSLFKDFPVNSFFSDFQMPAGYQDFWTNMGNSSQQKMTSGMDFAQSLSEILSKTILGDKDSRQEASRLWVDLYQRSLGKYLSPSKLGLGRESNEKVLQGFDLFVDFAQSYAELMSESYGGGVKSIEQVMAKISKISQSGNQLESFKDLFTLWTTESEDVFNKLMQTPAYGELQGKVINSYFKYQQHSQGIIEELLKNSPIATKGEIDQAFREITSLKRMLREFKAEIGELKEEVSALKSSPKVAEPPKSPKSPKPSSKKQ